jgi:hypothetical protein
LEHRWGRRYDTDVAVRFVALPGTIGTGRVTNISLTGAFMETACKLRLLSVVYIEDLDSGKERAKNAAAKRLAATVVRRCSAGVGLEWCERWSYSALEARLETSAVATSARDPAAEAAAANSANSASPVGEADPAGDAHAAVDEGQCIYRLEFID